MGPIDIFLRVSFIVRVRFKKYKKRNIEKYYMKPKQAKLNSICFNSLALPV